MSQENVEIVRRGIKAFNGRDLTRAFSLWSSDAEIDWSRSKGPLKGVYRGHAGLERFWGEFWSTFDSVEVETHGYMQVGANVVIPNTAYLRGREGIEVVARSTFVYTVEKRPVCGCSRNEPKLSKPPGCLSSQKYCFGREAAKSDGTDLGSASCAIQMFGVSSLVSLGIALSSAGGLPARPERHT